MKNKISAKTVAMLGMLVAVAALFGYVESFIPLNFIAPGVKLGAANAVALFLICRNRAKWAFFVNLARILLINLLFGNLFALAFSLSAGLISTAVMCLLTKKQRFGILAVSVASAVVHNVVQCAVAYFVVGGGVLYYLPFLVAVGAVTGALMGYLVYLLLQKIRFV